MKNNCFSGSRPFTLTELLVVMTIMVILFSIGVGGAREVKGPILTHMAGAEMSAALKRAHKTALKNGIPSAITFQILSGNVENTQGALFASDGQLETYFGFEDISVSGATATANGMKSGQTITGIAMNPLVPPLEIIDGCFGNGLYAKRAYSNPLPATPSINNVASTGSIIYMEAQVRYGVGTNSDIISLGGYSIKVDNTGAVYGYDGVNSFPSANPPNIKNEKWRKVGLMFSKGSTSRTGYFYFDGVMVGSANTTSAAGGTTSLSIGHANTAVDIDDIKVYNLMKSDVILNDLKSGFFVANGMAFTGSANLGTKTIILGSQGQLIGNGYSGSYGMSEDFIAFASTYVSGTTSTTSGIRLSDATDPTQTSKKTLGVTGPNSANLPESGYIVVPYDSLNFELIQYKDFSNGKMTIVKRQAANTPLKSTNSATTFYYAIPVIFNTQGQVQ